MLKTLLSLILYASLVSSKLYKVTDQVEILVNNIRPYNNPSETYDYYSLPLCPPATIKERGSRFGDALAGDRKKNSAYEIFYRTPVVWHRLCQYRLTPDDVSNFINAIKNDYVFELFVDGLPVQGLLGESETTREDFADHSHNITKYFIYTHLAFTFSYHSNVEKHEAHLGHNEEEGHVIAVNMSTDWNSRKELIPGESVLVDFSYSAAWNPTEVTYKNRYQLHQKSLEIHWLSIVNSFVLVILLTTFLFIILIRILKNDFSRYMDADTEELGAEIDDSGWKQVHGDVFRFPDYPMIISAAVGAGSQILALTTGILCLALFGIFYPGKASAALLSAGVILYAITSWIGGYVGTSLYIQFGGKRWASNTLLTSFIFFGPFLCVFSVLNSIAISYRSTSALPFTTILLMILIWALVTFPLTIYGSLKAYKANPKFDAPCKANFVRREIPGTYWYRSWPVHMFMAGFLPFSAIYIELHYIFASIWGHRVYTLFGILGLAFILLVLVTAFITVSLTYFQLAAEDYRWWWRSFLSGGSAGGFIMIYGIFYFMYRSNMNGLLQTAFYFGYVTMVCLAPLLG